MTTTGSQQTQSFLKTGEEFKESLRDGRTVWYRGERIEDVTTHPATAGGVEWLASLYDLQHDPEFHELMTVDGENGARLTRAWQIPRTKEDLRKRREFIEFTSRRTLGFFGRQLDNIALTTIGLAAYLHLFEEHNPELAGNILRYIDRAQKNNIVIAGLIADPQGARAKEKWSLGGRTQLKHHGEVDRLPPLLRVVERNGNGITISGAKIVGTVLPQAHEMIIITQPFVEPEESFWCAVPANAPGVHTVLRQSLVRPADEREHPVASRGEETDCLIVFDNVLVPYERVFSVGAPELATRYGLIGAGEHWNTLIRMCVKAELFVGLVQLIVDALGTTKVAKVRELVAEVIEYAQVLRAFVIAAEERAAETKSGVLWPDVHMVTAGRVFGVENYSSITAAIRELAGQGPLMLFAEADFQHPELGPLLSQVVEGFDMSAEEKNRLMGFVWDTTSDGYATRMEMFERLNGYPLFFLKERLYAEYDRVDAAQYLADFLGLPASVVEPAIALRDRGGLLHL
jgi:4-hydroxyphenylacetate 3-monooxygenase